MIVWNPTTGESNLSAMHGNWLCGCDFSADGRILFSYPNRGGLVFSDASTGREIDTVKLTDPDRPDIWQHGLDMRLSDDRERLVALSQCVPKKPGTAVEQSVLITGWNVATRKQLFRRRRADVNWHAVSPDLKMLATSTVGLVPAGKAASRSGADGSMVWLWELASARRVLALPAADTLNPEVAFSPDGRLLALTRSAKEILLWDLRAGKEWQRFTGFDGRVRCLAFSPDGKRLVCGLSNSTLLVWDVAAEQKAGKSALLDADGVAKAWADLAGDARKGFAARGALAFSPEKTLPVLKKNLKPAQPADSRLLRRLLGDLDSDTFETREKARKELEELGDRAAGALQAALKNKPSLEAHRRIEALLKRLRPPITDAVTLRSLRAIAVLEDIGTTEARTTLQALAKGAAAARVTREAKAALERFKFR
jgi:hypothetical protein